MARLAIMVTLVLTTASASPSFGEDPLDSVDGTEGWDEFDTSSVDESHAWLQWRFDLSRWEAGRTRLESERARMDHYGQRSGEDQLLDEVDESDQDLQARIDAARRTIQAGGVDERDAEGQSLDDERPWSRR